LREQTLERDEPAAESHHSRSCKNRGRALRSMTDTRKVHAQQEGSRVCSHPPFSHALFRADLQSNHAHAPTIASPSPFSNAVAAGTETRPAPEKNA